MNRPRRAAAHPWAIAALVAANLVPRVGVAVWGWRVADPMVLDRLENGVIGVVTVARMPVARPEVEVGVA